MFCCVTVRSARILANGSIFAPENNALFLGVTILIPEAVRIFILCTGPVI
jgi:hypothetical protein